MYIKQILKLKHVLFLKHDNTSNKKKYVSLYKYSAGMNMLDGCDAVII